MMFLPQFIEDTHWNNPPGSNAYIIVEGWGTILLGLAFIAFFGSNYALETRVLINRGIFVYFGPAAVFWLFDMLSRGFVLFGTMTFGLIVIFAVCGGFFGFLAKST